MGREVRKVSKNYEHPKDVNGNFIALNPGNDYLEASTGFMDKANKEGLQEAIDWYGQAPDINNYMPTWTEDEATHFMMFETVSEGTPISPPFETPEELAKWLADNKANASGGMTATYDQWLRVAKGGDAPSLVMDSAGLRSGVAL